MSCSGQSPLVEFGKTSRSQLKSQLGEPQRVENPAPKVEVLVYEDNKKFQIQEDTVVAGFREPTEEEKVLLYWRHQFRDCATTTTELAKPAESHLQAEKQLSCEAQGISVIYDPNIDQVTRVVEHAKK
jgi:hypothetical protein